MTRRAQDFFSGTGDFFKQFSGDREELVVINDGDGDLSFSAGYITFTLKAGEVFDEEVNPFNSIRITTTGAFRGFVREGQ